MRLKQRPHKSPLKVKFKFFEEYSLSCHMGAPHRVSKCLTERKRRSEGGDGVKSSHHLENNE